MISIDCPQQDLFKIMDGIPGCGPQVALFLYKNYCQRLWRVQLSCGCSVPLNNLPRHERVTIPDPPPWGSIPPKKVIRLCPPPEIEL